MNLQVAGYAKRVDWKSGPVWSWKEHRFPLVFRGGMVEFEPGLVVDLSTGVVWRRPPGTREELFVLEEGEHNDCPVVFVRHVPSGKRISAAPDLRSATRQRIAFESAPRELAEKKDYGSVIEWVFDKYRVEVQSWAVELSDHCRGYQKRGRKRNKKFREQIPGGEAAGKRPEDFDPIQLHRGMRVELEHTDDRMLATEIAMDHLAEDSDYYEKLATIHNPVRKLKNRLMR